MCFYRHGLNWHFPWEAEGVHVWRRTWTDLAFYKEVTDPVGWGRLGMLYVLIFLLFLTCKAPLEYVVKLLWYGLNKCSTRWVKNGLDCWGVGSSAKSNWWLVTTGVLQGLTAAGGTPISQLYQQHRWRDAIYSQQIQRWRWGKHFTWWKAGFLFRGTSTAWRNELTGTSWRKLACSLLGWGALTAVYKQLMGTYSEGTARLLLEFQGLRIRSNRHKL